MSFETEGKALLERMKGTSESGPLTGRALLGRYNAVYQSIGELPSEVALPVAKLLQPHMERLAKELGLTEEEAAQVKE